MRKVTIGNETITYKVRRSKRAKKITLQFHAERGFLLVAPSRAGRINYDAVFRESQAWVMEALEKARLYRAYHQERQYHDGADFPYLGKPLPMRIFPEDDRDGIRIRHKPDHFEVYLPTRQASDQSVLRQAFEIHYRRLAKAYLPRRVNQLAAEHGFSYNQLRIKHQKTLWGSCSGKRNLNLNMRLMMTPPEAIDYIIIHELCHLRELNHSKKFWALVESLCPEYDKWHSWLRENTQRLRF